MNENTLQFIADSIDGKLVVCDDGYVIEVQTGKKRVDFIYDEDGQFEQTKIK